MIESGDYLKAIVFDYNGTLVDDLDLAVESYYRAGNERGYRLAREKVLQHISQPPSAKRASTSGIFRMPSGRRSSIVARPFIRTWRVRLQAVPQTEDVLIALSGRYRLGSCPTPFGFFSRGSSREAGRSLPGQSFFRRGVRPETLSGADPGHDAHHERSSLGVRLCGGCGRGRADGQGGRGSVVCPDHRSVPRRGTPRCRRRLGGPGFKCSQSLSFKRKLFRKSLTAPRDFV